MLFDARLVRCMQFTNNPQDDTDIDEIKHWGEKNVYHERAYVSSTFKLRLASAVSLTLQVRHSSSNTVADWSDAAGPSLTTTAGKGVGVS